MTAIRELRRTAALRAGRPSSIPSPNLHIPVTSEKGTEKREIVKVRPEGSFRTEDVVIREEPLEIRLRYRIESREHVRRLVVTMRTPGEDRALALGFLFSEGILRDPSEVESVRTARVQRKEARENVLEVVLSDSAKPDLKRAERHFLSTAACGVCGKATIEQLRHRNLPQLPEPVPLFQGATLCSLPEALLARQPLFGRTGGLHGAALAEPSGNIVLSCEDIGRHNALDKLLGNSFLQHRLPLHRTAVLLSSRAGFELVQKTVLAGAPLLAAMGAPSSLAIEMAEETGLTLVGFLRFDQFNIYTHPERIF
jgi:FdhD protein